MVSLSRSISSAAWALKAAVNLRLDAFMSYSSLGRARLDYHPLPSRLKLGVLFCARGLIRPIPLSFDVFVSRSPDTRRKCDSFGWPARTPL
jgi:hypothetical protein